jgi:hypothetical protein
MDPPLSSSPRRDDAAPQDELEQIAYQMEWDNEHDVSDQSRDKESDKVGVKSGDEQGPRIGQGAWVGNKWHDPIDPHPVSARERWPKEAFDPDYEPEARQVMDTRLITTKQTIRVMTCMMCIISVGGSDRKE